MNNRNNQAEADLFHIEANNTQDRLLPTGDDNVLTRVLVVDDDNEMTDLLLGNLEPNSFEVISAITGQKGVELAYETHPDIVLIDSLSSEMDGWQVCREIRKFSQVPILLLSAVNKPGAVARALDEGADDYLVKPTPTGVLIAHLRRLTRRARNENNSSHPKIDYLI